MARFKTVLSFMILSSAFALPNTAMSKDWGIGPNGTVLECSDAHVLKAIEKRFRVQAREVHHDHNLQLTKINRAHQHRFEQARKHSPIARRYCNADAYLSNGKKRSLWYVIEDGMGLASIGDNVEFCIAGHDRWNVYDASCRVLR